MTLGAAVGEAIGGKKFGNKAILWGALAGTIPDLDILLYPWLDAVQRLSFHRGISHSLFFAFVAAPIFGWLVAQLHRKKHPDGFKTWSWLFFGGLFTHPLLDSFTTYGTQLFLPFSDYRVSLNSIFIVDPLYTLPFLACVIACLFFARTSRKRRIINTIGLTVSCLYLCFTLVNKQYINGIAKQSLDQQGIEYKRFMTSPAPLTNMLWYTVAETEKGYYTAYYSWFDKGPMRDFYFMPRNDEPLKPIKNTHAVDRLIWFSNGYYVVREKDGKLCLSDVKYGRIGFEDDPDERFVFSFID